MRPENNGSSPNSGERGADFEEEVLVFTEPVGHALDDLDLVVDALEHSQAVAVEPPPVL